MVKSKAAAAALSCLGFLGICAAPAVAAAPNVTFTASGTFAAAPNSGSDELKLAGEPFTISVVASSAAQPTKKGPNWALFSPLKMTGTVHSGLLGPTPLSIASPSASIQQAVGPTSDQIVLAFPVKVVGISLTIHATITLPAGTLPNQLIHTFPSQPLSPSTATVSYSDGADTTVLAIQTGSVAATVAK